MAPSHEFRELNSGLMLGLSNWAVSSALFLYIHNAEYLTHLEQVNFFL